MRPFRTLFQILCFAFVLQISVMAQAESKRIEEPCGQSKEILDPLTDEAERLEFNVKHIEIVGNTYTRYREFAKRMLLKGDIFRREFLEKTVTRISRMKTIYPISMESVEVRLNREDKIVNISFCVKQKPKH